MIQRSNELESALSTGQFIDYCKAKIDTATNEHKKNVWNCVQAYFSDDVTKELLQLLGYDLDGINSKLSQYVPKDEVNAITDGIAKLNNVSSMNLIIILLQPASYKYLKYVANLNFSVASSTVSLLCEFVDLRKGFSVRK